MHLHCSVEIFCSTLDVCLCSYGRQKRKSSHSNQKVDKERKRRVQEKCKRILQLSTLDKGIFVILSFQQHGHNKDILKKTDWFPHPSLFIGSGKLKGKKWLSTWVVFITSLIKWFQCLCNARVSLRRKKKKQQTSLKNSCRHLKAVRKAEWRRLFVAASWMQLKVRTAVHHGFASV